MDSKQMVSDLIAGSDNINRMRKEVEFVVKTVISFVTSYDITVWQCSSRHGRSEGDMRLPKPRVSYKQGECTWIISLEDQAIRVDCHLSFLSGSYLAYSTCSGATTFQAKSVQKVHEGLGTFLDSMLQEFPDLKEKLQTYWDAA